MTQINRNSDVILDGEKLEGLKFVQMFRIVPSILALSNGNQ